MRVGLGKNRKGILIVNGTNVLYILITKLFTINYSFFVINCDCKVAHLVHPEGFGEPRPKNSPQDCFCLILFGTSFSIPSFKTPKYFAFCLHFTKISITFVV